MVDVKIRLFATLRDTYRLKEIDLSCDGTVEGLVASAGRALGKAFADDIYDPKKGTFRNDRIVTVNGRNIKDIKTAIILKDGDEIAIFPPIGGG